MSMLHSEYRNSCSIPPKESSTANDLAILVLSVVGVIGVACGIGCGAGYLSNRYVNRKKSEAATVLANTRYGRSSPYEASKAGTYLSKSWWEK